MPTRSRSHPQHRHVVIVGGGLAGLFCALKLAPRPVTVISAAPLGQGASTAWAQGGIAAAVAEGDSAEAHAADTIAVGAGLVDESDRARDWRAKPAPASTTCCTTAFRSIATSKASSRSAARPRIRRGASCMCAATWPAWRSSSALIEAVRATPSIRVIEGYVAEALLTEDGAVTGLQLRRVGDAARETRDHRVARGGAGDRRHRASLCRDDQSGRGQRPRACDRRARRRRHRRSGIRAVSPDRDHGRPRSGAAGDRSPARRRRHADQRQGRTLHAGTASAGRTGAARHRGARRVRRNRRRPWRVPRRASTRSARVSPKNSRPSMQAASPPASIRRNSRSRSRPPRITTWAASPWMRAAAPR